MTSPEQKPLSIRRVSREDEDSKSGAPRVPGRRRCYLTGSSPISQRPSHLSSPCLRNIAEAFRSDVAVETHVYHFKKYKRTFVGKEAVDYMVKSNMAATRTEAVFLGQRLLDELSLFHHVCWDHQFKDGHLFYRFTEDDKVREESATSSSVSSSAFMSIEISSTMSTASSEVSRETSFETTYGSPHRAWQKLEESFQIAAPQRLPGRRPTYHQTKSAPNFILARELVARPKIPRQLSQPFNTARRVSFDTIQVRVYERILDVHPSTSSGPSVGLGWRYTERLPEKLSNKETVRRRNRHFILDRKVRNEMLRDLGYTKKEISQAERVNEKIKDQRKQTLNNLTAKTMVEPSSRRKPSRNVRRLFRSKRADQ
jgi:hypothetical protein